MKALFLAATAALALAGCARATAQTAAPAQHQQHHRMAIKAMTRAEVTQKVQQHFAMVDTNRDGVVTQAEAEAAKSAMHAKMGERRQAHQAQRFDKLDADNDGAISRQEYDSAHSQRQERVADGGMRHRGMHKRGMRHMAGMRHDMFKMADLNKDGQVTLQEATQAAVQHFDAADANRDGTISIDEMRAMHGKMRAMRAGS